MSHPEFFGSEPVPQNLSRIAGTEVHRTENICRTTEIKGSQVHRTAISKNGKILCYGALHLNDRI